MRWRYLQDLVLLRLVDLPRQAAVGDGVVDDGLVGLGAGLLEQLGTWRRDGSLGLLQYGGFWSVKGFHVLNWNVSLNSQWTR